MIYENLDLKSRKRRINNMKIYVVTKTENYGENTYFKVFESYNEALIFIQMLRNHYHCYDGLTKITDDKDKIETWQGWDDDYDKYIYFNIIKEEI